MNNKLFNWIELLKKKDWNMQEEKRILQHDNARHITQNQFKKLQKYLTGNEFIESDPSLTIQEISKIISEISSTAPENFKKIGKVNW